MTAKRIDGKAFAAGVRARVAEEVARLKEGHGIVPGLAVVLVGEDPASQVYVGAKGKQTVEVGMASFEHRLPAGTSEAELLALIDRLNHDPAVHGILVQLPLPAHLNADLVINALDPAKDVDGFHISNVGRLGTGQKSMVPCTPLGCLMMLRDHLGALSGLNAVVVGRSNIVGKPMAQLLLGESCTVTIAHSPRLWSRREWGACGAANDGPPLALRPSRSRLRSMSHPPGPAEAAIRSAASRKRRQSDPCVSCSGRGPEPSSRAARRPLPRPIPCGGTATRSFLSGAYSSF